MASVMYGAGLRLLECCHLRVKDVDFMRREITVRDGGPRIARGGAALAADPGCSTDPTLLEQTIGRG
jgi:hypothetical protein